MHAEVVAQPDDNSVHLIITISDCSWHTLDLLLRLFGYWATSKSRKRLLLGYLGGLCAHHESDGA
jgi:hypothetical protein